MNNNLLEIKNLKKTYQGKRRIGQVDALGGVDLEVKKGDFISLHGPSGCGKSTLLLTAGALLKPDAGEVFINGKNPYELDGSARSVFRARNIGFVFQRFYLIPYLKVIDNVTVPEVVTGERMHGRALGILDKFGLSKRINHYPSELSVGEQQRVALARAVYSGAPLLLADEPTGNLDSDNGKAVLEFLADFAKNSGAVLMVTHEEIAASYATKNVWMKDGKIEKKEDK